MADDGPEPARRAAGDRAQHLLALHDLAPHPRRPQRPEPGLRMAVAVVADAVSARRDPAHQVRARGGAFADQEERRLRPVRFEQRSEEHTSELQSLMRISSAVFCLKKKTMSPS